MNLTPGIRAAITRSLRMRFVRREVEPLPHGRGSVDRARRAVVVGFVGFLATQVLLSIAIRREWVPVGDPVFAEKIALLRQHPQFFASDTPLTQQVTQRVLMLGSSRTHLAFDAAKFATATNTRAFNFGCPAAGPMTSALYLRRLRAMGVTPDFVFVEFHPGFLTPTDPPFEGQWLHAYRLRHGEPEQLRRFGWNIPTPPHHSWTGWGKATWDFRFGLLNHYAPGALPCPFGLTVGAMNDPFGYVQGIETKPADMPRALKRTQDQYAPVLRNYHVGGSGCEALRDILTVCRDANIRAGIVITPEATVLRSWYGAQGNAEIAAFAQSLAQEFGVPVYDARDWVPDGAFADGHHLTARGATIFTERLAVESHRNGRR